MSIHVGGARAREYPVTLKESFLNKLSLYVADLFKHSLDIIIIMYNIYLLTYLAE